MVFRTEASATCPACSRSVKVSKSVFRSDFHCQYCDAPLSVSPLYARLIYLICVLLGYFLAWEIGIHGPRSCFFGVPWGFYLLWMPIGFLALMLLVRIAPFLVRPT